MLRLARASWSLLRETFGEWYNDQAPRLGAALSYYTIFALAPVLVVVIAVAGFFLGPEAAQGRLNQQLEDLFGGQAAEVVQTMLVKASEPRSGLIATVIGLVMLLVGATSVMLELQSALNTVWKVVPKPGQGALGVVKERALSLALVISIGFLLLVSLAMSAGLAAFGDALARLLPGGLVVGYVLNYGVSIFVVALFFGLLFKWLPNAKISWHDVWIGACVTSVLFHLGKLLIGLYLGKASVASAFGAAGSLAILLVWIYYSSQIVLLGAEFTRIYANRYGSHVVPSRNAVAAPSDPQLRDALQKHLAENPPAGQKQADAQDDRPA